MTAAPEPACAGMVTESSRSADELASERDHEGSDGSDGGDSACWASLVCPGCGAVPDGDGHELCARCGAATTW